MAQAEAAADTSVSTETNVVSLTNTYTTTDVSTTSFEATSTVTTQTTAAETTLTAAGVREAFAHREDDEMAEPVFVPRGDIAAYLRGLTDYRPFVAELLT